MIKGGIGGQSAPSFSAGDFLPPADNLYALGSAAYSWKELHVETVVYATAVTGNWSPATEGAYDLGTATAGWNGVYLSAAAGADADIDLLLVNVTGSPKLWWDESADAFALTHDLTFASGKGIKLGTYGTQLFPTLVQFGNDTDTLGPRLRYGSATEIYVRNAADDGYGHLIAGGLSATEYLNVSSTKGIRTSNSDNAYVTLQTRDNGVGLVEIARLQGAADPYFAMGNNGNAAKFYNSGAVEIIGASTFTGAATFNGNVVMGTMVIDDDSGAVTLVDMGVTDAPADGTEESYAFKLDGNTMFTIYGKSDGAGAVDELSLNCGTYLKLHITDTDGIATGQVWYDTSENKLKFKTASGVETISSS